MNILTQSFGATGKMSIDLDSAGLHVIASDSEKLSDQSMAITVKPDIVIDSLVAVFGSPSWLVAVGNFLKAEVSSLATPAPAALLKK